jgi:photoactive yellow protein
VPFDPLDVDDRSDAELDALPFGVICLAPDGTILRYNLAESRLARLDRNQVLGKSFFREIAPCTRGQAFEGRFRALVAEGRAGEITRFEYLFDFKFGAQEVSIEMLRARGAERFYLLVNRKKILAPRSNLPEGFPAPLQRELAPEESSRGVRRDAGERRVVEAPWSLFAALRHTCDEVAPEGWPIFCHVWGTQWGRAVAVDLETEALEAFSLSIREVPLRTAMEMLARTMAEQGWGALHVDFALAKRGAFTVRLDRSAVAEAVGKGSVTRCQLVAGMLGAVFTHLASRRLAVREVTCRARGDEACAFVAVPERRRHLLEDAARADERDLSKILARVTGEAPRG